MPFGKIAVVGSRTFAASHSIAPMLDRLLTANGPFLLVSGAADGPDTIAATWARSRGLQVLEFPADWDGMGKAAGMKRNADIVQNAECVIAFWDGESAGTLDTIKRTMKANKTVQVFLA